MYFQYGGYRHPDNEVHMVNFEYIPQFSSRGERWAVKYRMHIQGEIIAAGQSNIKQRIDDLINAYSIDNQTAALYHDDGTKTKHWLPTGADDILGNNLSGNWVEYRSWPSKGECEYATFRSFQIILSALFKDVSSQGQILQFRESVRYVGSGGPIRRWIYLNNGQPFQQITSLNTTQRIIQEGNAVGLDGWPSAVYYQPLLSSTFAHEENRLIEL